MDSPSVLEILTAAKEIVDANDILSTGDHSESDMSGDECEEKSFLHSKTSQFKTNTNSWATEVSRQRSIPTKLGGHASRGHVNRYVTMPSRFQNSYTYSSANAEQDTCIHTQLDADTDTHTKTKTCVQNQTHTHTDTDNKSEAPYLIKGETGVRDVLVESEYENILSHTHTAANSQPWWTKLLCWNAVLKP